MPDAATSRPMGGGLSNLLRRRRVQLDLFRPVSPRPVWWTLPPAVMQRVQRLMPLEGEFGLVDDLLDLGVDLAGLASRLFGQIGDGFLALDMAANDLGILPCCEVSSASTHGTILRLGLC